MRRSLADIVNAAKAVRAARHADFGSRLNPVAEMISCIRLAHRWAAECPERAGIASDLAASWAADAIN